MSGNIRRDQKTRPRTNAEVLQALLLAKRESDRRNWSAKYQHLRRAIQMDPTNFYVDQPTGRHWGVTHAPTGFRMHAPRVIAKTLPARAPDDPVTDGSGQFEVDPLAMPELSKLGHAANEARSMASLIRGLQCLERIFDDRVGCV